ncbi:hypothetical protein Ahy_B03g064352 [Arachis hypogaea]|uniref:Putative plant transposon protein domain-containing protein n=1 Tax=Arachis hypogaea TaxID=3818 RepID=A0A444ZZE4_ARAHY|nr:hypothetical protein Ahy_B03g064352 [Arachis hypogaea]
MLELRDLESRILRRQEEDETKFKELRVRVAGIVEAVGHLTSHLSSCAISTSIVGCREATPELSKDMNMELHGEEEELNQEPQQEEKIEISEQKEVVDGCLGYVEYIKESQVEETSSKECGGNIKERSNVAGVNNELKETDKEVDSISNDFLPTSINSLNDPVEPSPITTSPPASTPIPSPPPTTITVPSSPSSLIFFPPSFTAPLLSASRCLCATSATAAAIVTGSPSHYSTSPSSFLFCFFSVSATSCFLAISYFIINDLLQLMIVNVLTALLLPSTDPTKFPNLYCELRLSRYAKTKLNIEKKLNLPNDVRRAINARISKLGFNFVDRDLGRINISWVKEFYCNFFRQGLDSVHLRGREIMITEDALKDVLLYRVGTPETCAYQQAEVALLSMTFDYEALRRVIATPDASWVMDLSNTKPKGMLFAYLTREARTWQQIFAHYVFPTTHFSEIPMHMLVLIGYVMEGKEVYFPRLIRHSMWRAHIRGLLPFPTLVTSLAELADGVWVHEKPRTSRRSRARAVVEAARPSSSTAAGPSSSTAAPAPPSAPEPTYMLVQHLLFFMERFEHRVMRCLDRLDQAAASQGIELPPPPESSASDEQDQEEEHGVEPTQQKAPPVTQAATEVQQPPEVQHDIPEPQPFLSSFVNSWSRPRDLSDLEFWIPWNW